MVALRQLACLMIILLEIPVAAAHSDCTDAGILGETLVQNFCFDCLFPLRIATIPSQPEPMPPNVTRTSVCSCDGESLGVTVGSWHPVRLIEVVTTPAVRHF